LREDARAYVDRFEHEWNGATKNGMPAYLVGADYVKTFCSNKRLDDLEIKVHLSCPAKLYVFFDRRLEAPDWLRETFRETPDTIGLDCGRMQNLKRAYQAAKGPGESIDVTFSVWERVLPEAGIVTLGANSNNISSSAMYGIAAVPLGQPGPPGQAGPLGQSADGK
jgi:hypothetical protein